ncbi:coiled-coil domain-containing protein 28A [Patella vulgata]|uniref:coiled-coil domain-containing protein 28A n=1 Tax=Patella vulgata TaxID=6465 RepID=UPI0021808F84|nr:coiled-coil domain-containing protein 28A [Patella vulgata]
MESTPKPKEQRRRIPSAERKSKKQANHAHSSSTKKPDKVKGKEREREDSQPNRPCKEHSFLTDVADVREMEQGLLQLLDKFHSGKLRAFGGGSTFDQMDQVREQQERLARLHFDLDIQQDMHRLNSDEARSAANENLNKLIGQVIKYLYFKD